MKKSVIIAIFLIYLGSIVAVNFFGLQMKLFEGTEYVTKIECTGVELEREQNNGVYPGYKENTPAYAFFFIGNGADNDVFSETDTTNTNVVKINYRVYPDNATNSKIELVYDKISTSGAVVVKEDTMEIVFLKSCGIDITLKAVDGSNVQTKIWIECI